MTLYNFVFFILFGCPRHVLGVAPPLASMVLCLRVMRVRSLLLRRLWMMLAASGVPCLGIMRGWTLIPRRLWICRSLAGLM